jgi:hypothetical protein
MQLRRLEKLAHSQRRNRRSQDCSGSADNFADANIVVICHAASKTPHQFPGPAKQSRQMNNRKSFISHLLSLSLLSFLIEKTSTNLIILVVH